MPESPPDSKAHQRLFDEYIVPAIKSLSLGEFCEGESLYYAGFQYQEGTSDKVYFINAFRIRLTGTSCGCGDYRFFILTRWGRRGKVLQHKTIVALTANYQQEIEKAVNNRLKHGYEMLYASDCRIPVSGDQPLAVIGEHEEI